MAMAAILLNGAEPFEQIFITLLTEGLMWNLVKIGRTVSKKKTFKDFTIIHCKFQLLVFNCLIDLQLFSTYKCMGTQIWPCRKKVKGYPRIIIRTNLLDLESSMLYTKIQP